MKIIPNTLALINLVNRAFDYVIDTSAIYKIDESHALKHSMEVYGYAKKIYNDEIKKNPTLEFQQAIIYSAAIGHDMCDKKYMSEKQGIALFQLHMSECMSTSELDIMGNIIETMSYSKVKVNGYPDLGEHQLAYHIVREADLLSAYDIDRCIMYDMFRNHSDYSDALQDACKLFDKRVFRMRQDNLFITNYSKQESFKLHIKAKKDVEILKKIL